MTMCTQKRECLFGGAVYGRIRLNEIGKMVEKWWFEIIKKFQEVELDEYVTMPNHFHGIVVLVGADLRVCPDGGKGGHIGPPLQKPGANGQAKRPALPNVIQWFKTMTTNEYLRNVKEKGWTPISQRLWQRNYFEHVIRSEESLNKIREYVFTNPGLWETDPENPTVHVSDAPLGKAVLF